MTERLQSSGDSLSSAPLQDQAGYHVLFELNPYPSWIYDLNSLAFLEVNRAAIQCYGYSKEEFLAMTLVDIHPLGDLPALQDMVPTWRQVASPFSGLWQHRCKDGSIIDVQLTSYAVTWAGGPARCVLVQDITARKEAELALRENIERQKAITRIGEQIRQSLDLETSFLNTTAAVRQVLACDRVLIYKFDSDWSGSCVAEAVAPGWISVLQQQRVLQDNVADCSLSYFSHDTYFSQTQGIALKSLECLVQHDIDHANFSACYLERLAWLQAKSYLIVPIFRGDQLWGLLAAYQNSGPRHWQEAESEMMIQIGTQISSALQQAELFAQIQQQKIDLEVARDKAEAASSAKGQFLAHMSHELRTPLNAILGFAQLLSQDVSLNASQINHLNIILRSGEHLLDLINDVLEMSRIEAGYITLSLHDFDLHLLLQDLHHMLNLRAAHRDLTFSVQLGPEVPRLIRADEGKLRQVLINLVGNAIKFTQAGSVLLKVSLKQDRSVPSLSSHPDALALQFEIVDTGPGIAAADLEMLFYPFTQAEAGRKSGQGTGLGLTISRQFVQLMGGEISVSSQVGVGSTFCFWIQAEPSQMQQFYPVQRSDLIIKLAPEQEAYRVLVVDDQQDSLDLVQILLTEAGFEVRTAENGHEAIVQWQIWHPHLILMDMQMPVMDGYAASRYIRDLEQNQVPATKIIALTASAFEEQRSLILAAGCDGVIYKPFQTEDLLFTLVEQLGADYTSKLTYVSPVYRPTFLEETWDSQQFQELITPEQLSGMPGEWLERLRRAARNLSMTDCLTLMREIPPEQVDLTARLMVLLDNFQFEALFNILNQVTL